MKKELNICCDYDSFLNDYEQAWLDWVADTYGERHTTRDVLHWDWLRERHGEGVYRFFTIKGIYERVQPRPGAVDFVHQLLAGYGAARLRIVTATPHGMEEEKLWHIRRHFGLSPRQVIHAGEKWPATKRGVLIDDNRHHVLAHVAHNRLPGIVFDHQGALGWSKLRGDEAERGGGLLAVACDYREVRTRLGQWLASDTDLAPPSIMAPWLTSFATGS